MTKELNTPVGDHAPSGAAREQRRSFRCMVTGARRVGRLRFDSESYAVELIDESAGGFSVVCEDNDACVIGQKGLLQIGEEWFEIRVMNLREHPAILDEAGEPAGDPRTRIGLRRLRDLEDWEIPAERPEGFIVQEKLRVLAEITKIRHPILAVVVPVVGVCLVGGLVLWALEHSAPTMQELADQGVPFEVRPEHLPPPDFGEAAELSFDDGRDVFAPPPERPEVSRTGRQNLELKKLRVPVGGKVLAKADALKKAAPRKAPGKTKAKPPQNETSAGKPADRPPATKPATGEPQPKKLPQRAARGSLEQLLEPDIAQKLGLTPEQVARLQSILDEVAAARSEPSTARDPRVTPGAAPLDPRVLEVLTTDQHAQWQQLIEEAAKTGFAPTAGQAK